MTRSFRVEVAVLANSLVADLHSAQLPLYFIEPRLRFQINSLDAIVAVRTDNIMEPGRQGVGKLELCPGWASEREER